MFGHLKIKIFLFGLTCSILLFSANFLHAKTITEQSAKDFAKDHGGEQYVNVLNNEEAEEIFCGNKETICKRATETCLKCSYTYTTPSYGQGSYPSYHYYEKGKCVPIGSGWPEGKDECVSSYGGFSKSPGRVTEHRAGFIAQTTTTSGFFTNTYQGGKFSDGDNEYQLIVSEGSDVTIAYTKENFNGCEVLPVKMYNMQGCFFCPLAAVIFSSANDITAFAFDEFASSFGKLLVVVFAIWLAITTLNHVASMTKQDAPKFIAAIIKQGFKIAVAFTLLSNANYLFSYFVNPLLDGGLTLGKEIQTADIKQQTPSKYKNVAVTTREDFFNLRPKDGGKTLFENIEFYLVLLQNRLAYMQSIGSSLFCVGPHTISIKGLFKDADSEDALNPFKDGIRMMFLGGIMTVFAFLLTIAFGFYFLDAILQLAIIGAMLPLMIAGWPFKPTSQYASTGFKMLLNTFFVMFFIGFVICVNVELVDNSLKIAASIHNKTDVSNEEAGGLDALANAIANQNIEDLDRATSVGATGYLILAFGFLFGFKFVSKASDLANTLAAGGLKGGISSSIGTMGASFAKGAASKLTQPIRNVASDSFHKAGGVAGMASGLAEGVVDLASKGASKIGWKRPANFLQGAAKFAGKAKGLSQKVHSIYRDPKNN